MLPIDVEDVSNKEDRHEFYFYFFIYFFFGAYLVFNYV